MPLSVTPAGKRPGQRMKAGTRKAPSQFEFFSPWKGVVPASGGVVVRAVVRRVLDDRVVGEAEVVDQLQQLTDVHVVLDHAVAVLVLAGEAGVSGLDVGAEVHARAVPPAEEGRAGLGLPGDEVLGRGQRLLVDRLHSLLGERAEVLDGLATLAIGLGLDDAAGAELLEEGLAAGEPHVPRVVPVLRLLLGVQVIEAADELVEAVKGRQVLVAIALVVLAELAGGVAQALQDGGHRHVGLLPAFLRSRQADLGHTRAHGHAAADEGRAAGRAALLPVVVGEGDALTRHAVDVRRLVAHHPAVVVADVPGADVVAPDHQDVRLLAALGVRGGGTQRRDCGDEGRRVQLGLQSLLLGRLQERAVRNTWKPLQVTSSPSSRDARPRS
jgi:hypothetical protein